jgi:hypothetical protein
MSILGRVHSGDSYSRVVFMLCLSIEGCFILLVDLVDLAEMRIEADVLLLGRLMLANLGFERGDFLLVIFFPELVFSSSGQGALDLLEDQSNLFESVTSRVIAAGILIGFNLSEVAGSFGYTWAKSSSVLTDLGSADHMAMRAGILRLVIGNWIISESSDGLGRLTRQNILVSWSLNLGCLFHLLVTCGTLTVLGFGLDIV